MKRHLSIKEKDRLYKQLDELDYKRCIIAEILFYGSNSTEYLLNRYNEYSNPYWTYPNKIALENLMNYEIELLFRGIK